MVSFGFIENTPTSVCIDIPLGQPDPSQRCFLDDKRDRIEEPGHDGTCCWHFTFNIIRRRIGPIHVEELTEQRKIEAICEERLKKVADCEKTLPPSALCFEHDETRQVFQILDH